MTKSAFAQVLDVHPRTFRRWVLNLLNIKPELFTLEEFNAHRQLPPKITVVLFQEFGIDEHEQTRVSASC